MASTKYLYYGNIKLALTFVIHARNIINVLKPFLHDTDTTAITINHLNVLIVAAPVSTQDFNSLDHISSIVFTFRSLHAMLAYTKGNLQHMACFTDQLTISIDDIFSCWMNHCIMQKVLHVLTSKVTDQVEIKQTSIN